MSRHDRGLDRAVGGTIKRRKEVFAVGHGRHKFELRYLS